MFKFKLLDGLLSMVKGGAGTTDTVQYVPPTLWTPDQYKITPEVAQQWGQMQAFVFDEPGVPYPFSQRLAKRNSFKKEWDHKFALRVIEEYRKFFFIMLASGHMVTPSIHVDEVWHIHLLYTKSYWHDWCRDIMGKEIHHHPGNGTDEDTLKWRCIYERTLEFYAAVFGPAPEDIWGRPDPSINWREMLPKFKDAAPLNPMRERKPAA